MTQDPVDGRKFKHPSAEAKNPEGPAGAHPVSNTIAGMMCTMAFPNWGWSWSLDILLQFSPQDFTDRRFGQLVTEDDFVRRLIVGKLGMT